MVEINIEVFGEKIISRRLLRLGDRAVVATPAFVAIGQLFRESETKQFESEGAWASGGWVPDKQATINAKVANGFSSMTLQKTGAMMKSLTDPAAPYAVQETGPDFVFIKSTIPYGKFHQFGTSKMPMRKPVELNEITKVAMVKILQSWILGHANDVEDVVV
jgi:phage gpG-like protein